jgi:hypothetical protein
VWVPAGVTEGNAQVTLSLPGWEEGHVIPATLEVPVQELRKMRPRLWWAPVVLASAGALLVLAAGLWYVRRRQQRRTRA